MCITENPTYNATTSVNRMEITLPLLKLKALTKFFLLHQSFQTGLASTGGRLSRNKTQTTLCQSYRISLRRFYTKALEIFKSLWTAIGEKSKKNPSTNEKKSLTKQYI